MTAPAIRLVGVLELASKYRYGLTSRGAPLYLFRPYDEERPEYVVGSSTRDVAQNQIAIVEIPAMPPPPPLPPAKPRANLVRLIGPVGDRAAEETGLLEHYAGCSGKTAVLSAPPPPPDTSDDAARVELSAATGWHVFHVDPPGCRDVDDAIAWHPATGRWAVTIADAAAAVPPDSPADRAARAQGTSFYDLAGHAVRPMLPPAISEDAASLLPGQRRRGVSLIFPSAAEPLWTLSWITVAESFTYESFAASAVATATGATAVDPHDWIADWMIRYNTAAATLLRSHATGLLRTQSPADAAAVASWPPALRHLAAEAATYAPATTDTPEHAGLGLPAYTHASSPLRRYADLVNQRALKAIIMGAAAAAPDPLLADHLNTRTRAARRWTRDLTFLEHVVPGRVQELSVIWLGGSDNRVWVPDWQRVIRLRHEPSESESESESEPGTAGRIQIFCDPTRRNWRQRVLTAPA